MKKVVFILFSMIMALLYLSCKKDEQTIICPPQNEYFLSNLTKAFNFKKNSYWILKNSVTNLTDTLKVYYSTGIKISFGSGSSKECNIGDKYEGYTEFFYHKMFSGGSYEMDVYGGSNGIVTGYTKYCSCTQLSMYSKNIGDSVLFNNATNWSKLENLYTSITINGNTYNNVYQMFYYPDLYGFKRIWWCPNIGFVKFEYYNTASSQIEFWELDSYNVQLY